MICSVILTDCSNANDYLVISLSAEKEGGERRELPGFSVSFFLCRHGKFHGYKPEKNSDSRTSCSSKLPAHTQLSKTTSDMV